MTTKAAAPNVADVQTDEYLADVTGDLPDASAHPIDVRLVDQDRERRPNVTTSYAYLIPANTKAVRILPVQRNRVRAVVTAVTAGVSFLYLSGTDQSAVPLAGLAPDGAILPYLFGSGVGCAQIEVTATGELWVRGDGVAPHTVGVLIELVEDA